MNSDGGSLVGKAAFIALDTRVILGALLGWSLVSNVLKRWNKSNTTEKENEEEHGTCFSKTPHASILETEVKSLRKSLQNLRADNLVLAAQVAQLHGGMLPGRSSYNYGGGPKALNDAFNAAARPDTDLEPSSSSGRRASVLVTNQRQDTSAVEHQNINEARNEQSRRDAAEVVLLQKENEQLRVELEQLRVENEEMAERMLEVAFRGTDVPENEEISDLNQLGELRNALISEAGVVVVAEEIEEGEALWLEVDNKIDDDFNPNGSVFGGPTTPELAHEGGEASGRRQQHIPAAAYLEE
jgi:hypothetical protein